MFLVCRPVCNRWQICDRFQYPAVFDRSLPVQGAYWAGHQGTLLHPQYANGNDPYVGKVRVNQFIGISIGNLFDGLMRIDKDGDANPMRT